MNRKSIRIANWIAPNKTNLPDFIIGGAMKSGTTTLHSILNAHSRVYIPAGEIHFFDIDNILQHSDFNFYDKANDIWLSQSMEDEPDKMWQWYLSKFEGKEKLIKGEDSTTYLASRVAAERIAIQSKEIKLIFLLRHPTKRAHSQYYHFLRTGRATYNFEDTLKYNPTSILERSLYKTQLEYYYQLIPESRIKVILFEDLVKDTEKTIRDLCDYLHIDFSEIDENALKTHSNKAITPKNIELQAVRNSFLRTLGNLHYSKSLPNVLQRTNSRTPLSIKIIDRIHSAINSRSEELPPAMKEATKKFLDNFFIKELSGIDELVGQNILNKWFDTD
ncbi:MAG: sulfotransferase [Cyclobacteriaceae bacterium]